MEYGYSLVKHIKITNSDPICAIDLNQELLLFGTMLGFCGFYLINEKKLKVVSETEDEHILATQIKKDKLCFAVGDEKIIIVEKKDNNYNSVKEINNYYDDAEHYKKCNDIFCMLKEDLLFSIELRIPGEEERAVDMRICDWKISNYEKNKSFEGSIKLSNYWVPFDFDGKLLVYIDFYEKMKKSLKIYNFRHKSFTLSQKLEELNEEEHLGHISHVKILKNDNIFLVHSFVFCQIRDFKFKLIKEYEHKGKEIIACDVYYKEEKENKNNKENKDKKENKDNKDNKSELTIVLLDINCGVYLYHEKNNYEEYLFNLHKLYSIDSVIKEQKFFSLGYPYYIKIYKKLFAITTDQGCFLLEKQ